MNTYSFPGCHHVHDPAVKLELKSPGDSGPSKHKMYSTTDTQPIQGFNSVDIFESQGSSKRQKTASGVQFDGVMVTKPPPPITRAIRKSTWSKANTKKSTSELYEWLGKEYQAIVKTCAELSELFD